ARLRRGVRPPIWRRDSRGRIDYSSSSFEDDASRSGDRRDPGAGRGRLLAEPSAIRAAVDRRGLLVVVSAAGSGARATAGGPAPGGGLDVEQDHDVTSAGGTCP